MKKALKTIVVGTILTVAINNFNGFAFADGLTVETCTTKTRNDDKGAEERPRRRHAGQQQCKRPPQVCPAALERARRQDLHLLALCAVVANQAGCRTR